MVLNKHNRLPPEKTKASRVDSEVLRAEGTGQMAEVKNLRDKLNREKDAVEQLKNTIRLTGEVDNKVVVEMQKLADMRGEQTETSSPARNVLNLILLLVSEDLTEVVGKIADLDAKLKNAERDIQNIRGQVADKLEQRLTNFTVHGRKKGIEKAAENSKFIYFDRQIIHCSVHHMNSFRFQSRTA